VKRPQRFNGLQHHQGKSALPYVRFFGHINPIGCP
jgi:hypothetical protein